MSDILLAYVWMYIAQISGAEIIGVLHGQDAKKSALKGNDDVDKDAPLEALCLAYESHHTNLLSNVLHAAGMCLAILSVASAITGIKSVGRIRNLTYAPPLYYLSAWAGHFFLQKDIPAVFSYGMSLRGWATGEYCSMRAFFGWGERGFVTLSEPWQWLLTLAITASWTIIVNGGSVAPRGTKAKIKRS